MDIRSIRTTEDYEAAFAILDKHWPAEEGTEEYDCFDILSILILNYEKENRPIDLPDPVEALKYYMQQDGHSVEELGLVLRDQTLAQKLLDKTAPMTLAIVYELYKQWDYPVVPFLKPYKLVSDPLAET